MKVVAIIPTLNEEKGIAEVISGFQQEGVKNIVVADGGSTDKTREIAKRLGVEVIPVPRGKGNGFRSAIEKISLANETIYIMIDGDASYSSGEVKKLLNEMKNYDVVTGRRNLLIHNVRSAVHAVGNFLISIFGSLLYMHWSPDICTGYWAFRGSALKKLRGKLNSKKFELEVDLFSRSKQLRLKHKSVPITYSIRKGEAKLRSSDALQILKKLIINRFS